VDTSGGIGAAWENAGCLEGAALTATGIKAWRYIGGRVVEMIDTPYNGTYFDAVHHRGRVIMVIASVPFPIASSSSSSGGSSSSGSFQGSFWVGVGTPNGSGGYTWCSPKRLNFPAGASTPRCGAFRLAVRKDDMIEMTYSTDTLPCIIRTILSPTIASNGENTWF
jgi:hypothetical protein